MSQKLDSYISNVQKCKNLIGSLGIPELEDLSVFDLFCYWYDRIRQPEVKDDNESEDEIEYVMDEKRKIAEIDLPDFIKSVDLDNISFDPHSLEKPDTIKINRIIEKCTERKWVLPNFQRYFSWKKNDVKEFLQSIFNDYYVGALLFWEVAKEVKLDVVPVRGVSASEDLRPDLIILDGQQRITSLYYAIKAPDFPLEGSKLPLYFYINFATYLKQNEDGSNKVIEVLPRKLTREESFKKMLFPFYELEQYAKWAYDFEDFLLKSSPDNYDKIRKIRSIIERKLRFLREEFEIPYISLPESIDLDEITDIFERINTMGLTLDVFDLLIARLSKYESIELKKVWEDVTRRYPKFQKYNDATDKMPYYILQSTSLSYNKTSSCKRADILNIYQNVFEHTGNDFGETWYHMSDYINKAMSKLENLRDGFGIKDENQVPFTSIIPIVASLIKEIDMRENKVDCNKKLSIWYWSSVFSNAYSGAVDS